MRKGLSKYSNGHLLVLFDIDGTILRFKKSISREIFSNIIKELFKKELSAKDLPSFAGMTDLQILKEIFINNRIPLSTLNGALPIIWEKLLIEFRKFCNKESVEILPGINELLSLLSGLDSVFLGLLTGNFKDNAYLKLSIFNLEKYFQFGAFGSDHEDRNKLPMLAIERANEIRKKKVYSTLNTILIGDSPRDIECAESNSLPIIAVATGGFSTKTLKNLNPDFVFENFSDYKTVYDKIIHFA